VRRGFLAKHELAAGRITRVLPDYRASGGTAYLVHPPHKRAPGLGWALPYFSADSEPRRAAPT